MTLTEAQQQINKNRGLLSDGTSSGYKIGKKETPGPLTRMEELRAHLRLLSAFGKLRESVHLACEVPAAAPTYAEEEGRVPPAPAENDPSQRMWTNYLTRASYRLEAYCALILTDQHLGRTLPSNEVEDHRGDLAIELPGDQFLPPIDVAMLWHAYLLNPLRASEDAFRRVANHGWLLTIRFPLERIAKYIDDSSVYNAPSEAHQLWHGLIDQHYVSQLEPPPAVPGSDGRPTSLNGLMMSCPKCSNQAFVPFTALNWPEDVASSSNAELGMSDEGWERQCTRCSQKISKDTLQGRRLLNDLQAWAMDPSYHMPGAVVDPGTGGLFLESPADAFFGLVLVHTPRKQDAVSAKRGLRDAKISLPTLEKETGYSARKIAKQCEYYLVSAQWPQRQRNAGFRLRIQRRARLLFSPILDSGVIGEGTVDLVAAAKRQQSFCAEMERLKWSEPARLAANEDDASLARGLVRYHKWLDLMANKPKLLCPTLDIDLCWHTHQLTTHYEYDMHTYVGRFVDHDDKIEEGLLSNAFKQTADLWKSRFNQPYSSCGCTHNAPGVVKTISRVFGGEGKLSERVRASRDRPADLDESSFEEATHPSAHPAVAIQSQEALKRSKKRLEQSEKRATDGKRRADHPDPFIAGYGYMPLYPFYVPCYLPGAGLGAGSCVSASCCNGSAAQVGGTCAGGSGAAACGSSGAVCAGGSGGGGCAGGGGGCGGGGSGGGCGGGGC